VVVGDALLDRDIEGRVERLCPDAPAPVVDETTRRSRPGGAGLAAALAANDGHPVTLITALGGDPAGRELAALLTGAGVEVVDLGLDGSTPEKVRIRTDGRSLLRLDRGSSPRSAIGPATGAARDALRFAAAILVSDYGRGVSAESGLRSAFAALSARIPVVWDPHPKGAEPVSGVRLVTPNKAEAAGLVPEVEGGGLLAATARARTLLSRWRAAGVAVTLGADGALFVGEDGQPFVAPATKVTGGDVCGAGDRFASRVAGLLADGESPPEAVAGAVLAASSFVAAGGAGSVGFPQSPRPAYAEPVESESAQSIITRVRGGGGTVVATGGCFDLLHAAHVRMLRAARSLGDCLIVCLNSDSSVRRIKGSDRPLVPEEDRAAVLGALGCVDAVVLFDEETPEAVLERLRPDVFAKGGDYAVADLPEAKLLARWGGQAVILPYVAGRSTTRLIEEAVSRGVR
jgi:rfaE bifunctional protein nucleotidyltransferase chain/domain/rfaE bifunctional protein kinase chain/domain